MKCSVCKTNNVQLPKAQLCDPCYKRIDSRNLLRKDGRWSIYADKCKECSNNKDPHKAWGFCNTCYKRNLRKMHRQGLPTEIISKKLKEFQPKIVKVKRMCQVCGSHTLYNYGGGTELPVCFAHYYEWRKEVSCDGCGQPCVENAVDTEDDNGIVYWWHFKCWERACSTEQKEQLLSLTTAS